MTTCRSAHHIGTSCMFMDNIICCVTEEPERLDKRKALRERRQCGRERYSHMERFGVLGRKAIRKIKAIEKAMEIKSINEHFAEQQKTGICKVWIPGSGR